MATQQTHEVFHFFIYQLYNFLSLLLTLTYNIIILTGYKLRYFIVILLFGWYILHGVYDTLTDHLYGQVL